MSFKKALSVLESQWPVIVPFVFSLVGLVLYAWVFDAGFHFDDGAVIFKPNHQVMELNSLLRSFKLVKFRYVGSLTLAINYALSGNNAGPYHVTNVLIHILASLLVWIFTRLFIANAKYVSKQVKDNTNLIATVAGLLFLVHPIQTQAVSYIVQRYASLATVFYLASLIFYLKARLCKNAFEKIRNVFLGLIMFLLGFYTKEIVATLPVVVMLLELTFSGVKFSKKKILYFMSSMLVFVSVVTYVFLIYDNSYIWGVRETPMKEEVTSKTYLLTQFKVIPRYVQLIVAPVNQNIDHYMPVAKSLRQPEVFIGLGLIILAMSASLWTWNRNKLLGTGLLWFFITLSIESSIVTIEDVMFEHRLYLPMVGVSLFFSLACFEFLMKKSIKLYIYVVSIILVVFGFATFKRNEVWQSEFTLWSDSVKKAPKKARPHVNLGAQYQLAGDIEKAMEQYRIVIEIDPDRASVMNNLGILEMRKGELDKAIEYLERAVELDSSYEGFSDNLNMAIMKREQSVESGLYLEGT